VLVYADDMNPMGDGKDAKKKKRQTLNNTSKEAGIEENTKKSNYPLLSCYQIQDKIITQRLH
jgi:hypothetical protein